MPTPISVDDVAPPPISIDDVAAPQQQPDVRAQIAARGGPGGRPYTFNPPEEALPSMADVGGAMLHGVGELAQGVIGQMAPLADSNPFGGIASAGIQAAQQYSDSPNAVGKTRVVVSQIPFVGPIANEALAPSYAVAENRAPTPAENLAPVSAGTQLLGMAALKVGSPAMASPEIASPGPSGEAENAAEVPKLQETEQTVQDVAKPGAPTRQLGGPLGEIQRIFNPAGVSPEAQRTADILDAAKAKIANDASIQHYKYRDVENAFTRMGDRSNIANISNYERTGELQNVPEGYSKFYRDSTDNAIDIQKQVYGDDQIGYVENYVRRAFNFTADADADRATPILTNWVRSLSASKAPLKGRVLDMPLDDALQTLRANGVHVELATTNPETLRQWTVQNANQALTYKTAIDQMKSEGLVKFVPMGETPRNMVPLDDRVFQVFHPSEEGMVKTGQYYADPNVATILNNTISKGLGGSPTFRGIRTINNTLNTFNLGLSAYHATFSAITGAISDAAFGVGQLLSGNPGEAATAVGRAAVPALSATRYAVVGRDLVNRIIAGDPAALDTMDKLNQSGGRIQIDQSYKMAAYQNMMRAWYNATSDGETVAGRAWQMAKAAGNAPMAIVQKLSAPLMEYAIPRIKLGAWLDQWRAAADKLGPDASQEQLARAGRKAWDNVDDMFGLMVHDNFNWNKTMSDIAQVSVRSVGWQGGSLRWLGSAAKDLSHGELSNRVLSAAMVPIVSGVVGGAYTYLHTGKPPQSIEDLYFPRNGLTDKYGNPERVSPATYMRTFAGYAPFPVFHGEAKNPMKVVGRVAQTAKNALSPMVSIAADFATNSDYIGNMIRNPEDPAVQQLEQMGANLLSRIEPFSYSGGARSVRTAEREGEHGPALVERGVESFAGFPPAPRKVVKSNEELDREANRRRLRPYAPMTPEEVARRYGQ